MLTDQLTFDVDAVLEEDMTEDERQAVIRDFLSRFSGEVRTNGALRARPCGCEPTGLPWLDVEDHSRRCIRCGRAPRSATL